MRRFAIILCFLTVASISVAQDALMPSKFLPQIRDAQLENLDKIDQLSISAVVRLEWANPMSIDTADMLALWIPSKEEFLATDPFPAEPERSWKKNPITIALLFGGSDGTSPPWKLFDRIPAANLTERVSVEPELSAPDSYVVSTYYGVGEEQLSNVVF